MSNSTNQIWIPPTTSKTVVFPFDKESKTLQKNFYEPELTSDQVSIGEVNQFFNDIESEFKSSETDLASCCFVFIIMILFLMDFMVTIVLSTSPDRAFELFTNEEAIALAWIVPFVIFLIFKLCNGQLDDDNFSNQRNWKCRDIVEEYNGTLESKGLKWHLPEKFPAWIELTKHMDKKSNDGFAITNQSPIPATTELIIIFPAQRFLFSKIYRFTQDFYSPDMVDGRVSSKEMTSFLIQINEFLRRPIEESFKISYSLLLWLCFELFGLFYIYNHLPNLLTTLTIVIIAAISVILCIILYIIEFHNEEKKINMQIKNGCQEILDQHNRILRGRGLRWRLPEEFPDWIELCKDDKNNNLSSQQSEREPEERKEYSDQDHQKKMKKQMYVPLPEANEEDV